jgi:cytochrome P450
MFENPDVVDIERNTDASLVWGKGIHLCMGAPLARLEMRVALEELLARTTCIELVGAPPHRVVYPGNGLAELSLHIKDKPNSRNARA